MRRVRAKRVRLLLDSGAYNVWNRRRSDKPVEPIDIGAYCEYVARNRDWLHGHVVLDEIPPIRPTVEQVEDAALQSYINLRAMKRAGLDPMPVYHQGEDISWLQRLIDDGHDYIGISPVKLGMSTKRQRVYLDAVFTLLSNHPHITTHGFGVTKSELLINYPFTTVDSTTWALSGGNHIVYLPPRGDDGGPDYTRKAIKISTSHVQEPEVLQWAEEYIEGLDAGLTWFQIERSDIARRQLILHYLTALSESRGIAVFHATNPDASASEILAGRQITDHLLSYFDLRSKRDEVLRSHVQNGGKARRQQEYKWAAGDWSRYNDPDYLRFRRAALRRRLASGG